MMASTRRVDCFTALLLAVVCVALVCCTTPPQQQDKSSSDDVYKESDESKLVKFIQKRYQLTGTNARPILNSSGTITVQFALTLYQIIDVDEKNQVLTTKLWKSQIWTDEFLKWDPEQFGGIRGLNVPPKSVWTPDIILYNNVGEEPTNFDAYLIPVNENGTTNWSPSITYRSTCEIDMRSFPFDEQTCELRFGSWSYDVTRLKIVFTGGDQNFDLNNYVENSEWEIVKTSAERIEKHYSSAQYHGTYEELKYSVTVRRKVGFTIFVLLVPGLLLSLLTPLLFWIPPARPDRTTLGMNLFASFFVLLLILVQTSPSSASVSYLGLYYCFSMVLIAATTMLSCVIIYVNNNYTLQPMPRWVRKFFVEFLAKIFLSRAERATICGCSPTALDSGKQAAAAGSPEDGAAAQPPCEPMTNPASWKMLVMVLDRVCFTVSSLVVIVAIIVLFPR